MNKIKPVSAKLSDFAAYLRSVFVSLANPRVVVFSWSDAIHTIGSIRYEPNIADVYLGQHSSF